MSAFLFGIIVLKGSSIRCLANSLHKSLSKEDTRIKAQNKRLRTACDAKFRAEGHLDVVMYGAGSQIQLDRAAKAVARANDEYEKAAAASADLVGTGSGKVGLLLPSHPRPQGSSGQTI